MSYSQAYSTAIPELWRKEFGMKFYDETYYKSICNTEYEGDIRQRGDTVHVNTLASVSIGDYDNATGLTYAALTVSEDTLVVDQEKYWAVKTDLIGEKMSDMNFVGPAMADAAKGMADSIDTYMLGSTIIAPTRLLYLSIAEANITDWATGTAYAANDLREPTTQNGYCYKCTTAGTSHGSTEPTWPTTIGATVTDNTAVWTNVGYVHPTSTAAVTASNLYTHLVNLKKAFRKQNTWREGKMWAIVPAEIEALINTSSELTHATQRADEIIKQGFFGTLAGFNIMVSNNVTGSGAAASPFSMLAGNDYGLHMASNVTQTDVFMDPDNFGTRARGLLCYGMKNLAQHKYCLLNWQAVLG